MGKNRLTACVVCLAFAASLVIASRHLASAMHGYCTDHGKLIHLTAAASSKPSPVPWSSTVRNPVHVTGEHGCAFLEFLSTPAIARARVVISPAQLARRTSCPAVGLEAHGPISLLHQAPKISPPSV